MNEAGEKMKRDCSLSRFLRKAAVNVTMWSTAKAYSADCDVRRVDELQKRKKCEGIELSGVRLWSVMTFGRGV
jgi:hypothetical protein